MRTWIAIFTIFIIGFQELSGQAFGQNKVQYRQFDWQFIKTPHFDIYFYGNDIILADFTAEIAEEAYEQIAQHLRWNLRKPVSVIIYNSHNDFQSTNVTTQYMGEGIGGVTELFKNRVVVPFEGSYEQFRHVIHHELVHAVVNDMVYGGSVQSIVSGAQKLSLPLWVNEGIAEYLSSNWDTKADMIIRDLAINDYIPSVKELDYYMAYKGGQSVWRYIAQKYGREKVGEIYISMKKSQNAERGYEQALGMDFKDLTDQWHKYLKKEYWPDVTGRDAIEDIATKLTDHVEKKNYFNISPAISPDGSKIAILSDRSMYADIFLINAVNGEEIKRIVKGNRSIDFEELKWLQPGISWSPDGNHIVIASKAGERDAFNIINVETGSYEKIALEFDGLFTASWSPDGKVLAFVGNIGSASDIYVLDIESRELTNLTDDLFSDSEPNWNPDGSKLVFVSDRGNYYKQMKSFESEMFINTDADTFDFSQTDIFTYDFRNGEIEQITNTFYNEKYPIWSNKNNKLLYTADDQGVWNIYVHELDSDEINPITNVQTGIQQLSLSKTDDFLIFSGYSKRGWDIYSITNPFALDSKTIEPTNFASKRFTENQSFADLRLDKDRTVIEDLKPVGDYSHVIFLPQYDRFNNVLNDKKDGAGYKIDSDSTRMSDTYIPEPYKTRFTLDLVSGNLAISNVFGTQGMTYFLWSDILGDHQIYFGTEMVLSLQNSDYVLSYGYLKKKTDYYFNLFQTADFFGYGSFYIGRLRHYGLSGYISRPFSRFQRLDFGISFHKIEYKVWFDNPFARDPELLSSDELSAILPAFSWVFDNSIWSMTGPVDGLRYNASLTMSPKIGKKGIQFQTFKLDFRKYIRLNRNYSIAARAMYGKSIGPDAQKFFLGGVYAWLFGRGETDGRKDTNQYRDVILDSDNESLLEDVYFTEYVIPVRGARYAERFGTNVFLSNFEFRFPFIDYLSVGFPLRMIFGNIRGHAFLDIGTAWDDTQEFDNHTELENKYGSSIPKDFSPWVVGTGVGVKINLGFALLRIDTAWDINPGYEYSRPQYYFSLGYDW
ncbi:peptidase MA family metallohydrolase [Candidatus Neomarinimicrobiota bacterium]